MKENHQKRNKTEEQWKTELSYEQYRVLRQCGTEAPFTGKYNNFKDKGVYLCAGCGQSLFSSDAKYNSGSGWPSYYKPLSDTSISEKKDTSSGMVRVEIVCNNCGSHLGHVFEDGPDPTGLRYCVNSISLDFKPEKDSTEVSK